MYQIYHMIESGFK